MYASVRVEGKLLEFCGGEGGAFPFRVVESNRRSKPFIKLSFQEFRWLAIEMVRFCLSKGDPLWVRTFKVASRCLLLQLRKNARGRFIVFSVFGGSGRSRTVIFPEGSYANGWFALTKILKEFLIYGKHEASPKQRSTSVAFKSRVGRHLSYVNAVRGRVVDSRGSILKGWRCRECGSWDVYTAVLGKEKDSNLGSHNK